MNERDYKGNQAEEEFKEIERMIAEREAAAADAAAADAATEPAARTEPSSGPKSHQRGQKNRRVPSNPARPETPEEAEKRIQLETLRYCLSTPRNRLLPALPATVTATFTTLDLEKAINEIQQLIKDSEIQIGILDSVAEKEINFFQDLIALEKNEPNYQRKLDDKSLILVADSLDLNYFIDNFPVFRRIFITNIDELIRNRLVRHYVSHSRKILITQQVEKESVSPPIVNSEIISSLGSIVEKKKVLRQLYGILLQVNNILDIKTKVLNEGFVERRELIKTNSSILFNHLCFEVYQLRRLLDIYNSFIKGNLFANQNIRRLRPMGNTREVEVTSGIYQADGVIAMLVFRYNMVVDPSFRITLRPMTRDSQDQTEDISLRFDSDYTKEQQRKPVLSIDLTGFKDIFGNYPLYRNPYYQEYIIKPIQKLFLTTSGIELVGMHHFVLSGTQDRPDLILQIISTLRSMFNEEHLGIDFQRD